MTRGVAVLSLVAALGQTPAPGVSGLQLDSLADGPYARMHMLFEKTIFGVDILTVDMRFDAAMQRRLRALVQGQPYTDALAARVADAVVTAEDVYIELEFKRDVSLNRWVDGVRDNLRKAQGWGVIDAATYRSVADQLPTWFSGIADRGFRSGDRILYRVRGGALRTVLVGRDGRVFVDQTDTGSGPRRALLGGYFAPDTGFREPLVRSLFGR